MLLIILIARAVILFSDVFLLARFYAYMCR